LEVDVEKWDVIFVKREEDTVVLEADAKVALAANCPEDSGAVVWRHRDRGRPLQANVLRIKAAYVGQELYLCYDARAARM